MDIKHYEELMRLFEEHRNPDGSSGFDIDKVLFIYAYIKFRDVFGQLFGSSLSYDQVTMLFMKIDANSDGTVDWNEFSEYMISGSLTHFDESNVSVD
jgi:Ca2+-binding EF-hand superfamily protein